MVEVESSSSKPKPNEEDDKVAANDPHVLENTYYYQNLKTGSISTSPLTVRQLCKILCPPSATQAVVRSLTPDSSIIGFDTSTNQYSSDGWQILKSVPVLKECCSSWYYYGVENGDKNGTNKDTQDTQESQQQQQVVKGPVTCRFLAKLLSDEAIQPETKVYCHTTEPQQQQKTPEWKPIHEIPSLRIAMLAFDTTPPPWQLNTTTAAAATDTDQSKVQDGTTLSQQQEYDASIMTFDTTTNDDTSKNNNNAAAAEIQDELEAFLTSTAGMGPKDLHSKQERDEEEEEEEGYESDGGTTYVKDPLSGNYIHSALVPPSAKPNKPTTSKSSSANITNTTTNNNNPTKKRKKKQKAKFSAKSAKCWVYVTGLPLDCTLEEVIDTFSKVGILDLDPETQKPKVKLYKHHKGPLQGTLKGDASICYARPESVDLALQLLDEAQFIRSTTVTRKPNNSVPNGSSSTSDPLPIIRVQRAKFEQHGDTFESTKKRNISQAKRKVARMAALQAVDWDEGDNGRISGGRKGLRIIVLKHMFHPRDLKEDTEDAALRKLEQDVHTECERWGTVEKITIFAKNPQGVMIVKFAQPSAASTAVKEYNGRSPLIMNHASNGKNGGGGSNKSVHNNTQKIDANYWDGVTDYTMHDEEKEIHETKKRHDEFGTWLDNQDDLPEEFKLQVEGH